MKSHPSQILRQASVTLLLFSAVLGATSRSAAQTPAPAPSQSIEASLPAGVEDVVKLTRAGLNEDVILAQIKSAGSGYQLNGDQIIFLTNAGVSQNVIKALISGNPQTAVIADKPAPAANPVSIAPPVMPVPLAPPPPAVSTTVYVPVRVPWFDSNIDLAAGQPVTLTAAGRASYGPRERDRVSPEGNPALSTSLAVYTNRGLPFLAPDLTPESLIGKIGQFGQPFEIGAGASFTAPAAGRLYLSMNDNSFRDNSGEWSVTVTLPQSAPVAPIAASYDYFHEQLAPFGSWVQVAGYGWCWSPASAVQDPNWRPYSDQGQWVYTDTGWFWQSEYSWGDIVFHYGRWYQDTQYGWLWVPDYTWAPSWVAWRHAEADGYIGWAPLPPGARFIAGEGLFFNGRLAFDIDFGLPERAFIFVGFDHFWGGGYRSFALFGDRAAFVYGHSVVQNGYRMEGGRFIVDGLGRDRIVRYTHRDVRPVDARGIRANEEQVHLQARRGREPLVIRK